MEGWIDEPLVIMCFNSREALRISCLSQSSFSEVVSLTSYKSVYPETVQAGLKYLPIWLVSSGLPVYGTF